MFRELAEKRYSLRNFDANRPIERAKLDYLLDCVRLAPSAVNFQPYKFFIVTEKLLLQKLSECYSRDWFRAAPACIVACANNAQAWHRGNDGKNHADIDVAIAVDHLTLAAAEVGLGTWWVCNFDAKKCAEFMQLSAEFEPIALIPIGYASAENVVPEKKRKSSEELFEFI